MQKKRLLIFVMVLVIAISTALVACDTDKNDITYGEWVVDKLPTETEPGLIKRQGSDGAEDKFELPALNSELYKKEVVKEATINDAGSIKYTIKVKDKDYSFEIVVPVIRLQCVKEANGIKEHYLATDGTKYVIGLNGDYVKASDSDLTITADTSKTVIYINDVASFNLYKKSNEAFENSAIYDTIIKNITTSENGFSAYLDSEKKKVIARNELASTVNANANTPIYVYEIFDVIVNNNYDNETTMKTALYGDKYSTFAKEIKGYTLVGIYSDKAFSGENLLDKQIVKNGTTIYINYVAKDVTITFDSKGGSTIAPITAKAFAPIVAPTNPTYGEAIFEGWYTDKEYTTPFTFDKMPNNDITLYAKWKFNYTVGLEFTKEGETYVVSGYKGESKDIVIPNTYNKLPVVGLNANVFKSAIVNSIHVGDNVTKLSSGNFDCYDKNEIAITGCKSVTTLEGRVFYRTLTDELTLPALVDVPTNAFEETIITKVNLPKAKNLKKDAFKLASISELILPSLESISETPFADAKIWMVNMENLSSCSDTLFENNGYIYQINVPKLKSLNTNFVNNCRNLADLNIESANNLDREAINNCPKLEYLNLSNVQTINTSAISSCPSLDVIKLTNFTKIDSNAFKNSSIKKLIISRSSDAVQISRDALANVNIDKLNISAEDLLQTINGITFCKEILISKGKLGINNIVNINGLERVFISDFVKNASLNVLGDKLTADVYYIGSALPEGFHPNWLTNNDKAMIYSETEPTMEQWLSAEGYWHGDIKNPVKWTRPYSRGLIFAPIKNGEEYAVSKFYRSTRNMTIPETYKGKKVTTIKSDAFNHSYVPKAIVEELYSIDMPYIKTIESGAFVGYQEFISEIEAPRVETIGKNAFTNSNVLYLNITNTGTTNYSAEMFDKGSLCNNLCIASSNYNVINKDRINEIHIGGTSIAKGDITSNSSKQKLYIEETVTSAEAGAIAEGFNNDIYMMSTTMPAGFDKDFNKGSANVYLYSAEIPTDKQWQDYGYYWHYSNSEPMAYELDYTRGLKFDAGNKVVGYDGTSKDIVIPLTYRGNPVMGIVANVFAGMSLDSLTINLADAAVIDDNAFKDANIKRAFIPAKHINKLDATASCASIDITSATINAGEIASFKEGATLYLAESVISVKQGAITSSITSNVYLRHKSIPNTFEAGFNAGSGTVYVYSQNDPTSSQWMKYDKYWHYDVNGAIAYWTINYTKGLNFVSDGNGNYIVSEYKGADTTVEIPKVYGGCKVVGIGNDVFLNNKDIVKVILGDNVVSLGNNAFAGCTSLTTITGIERITTLGSAVFDGMTFASLDLSLVKADSIDAESFKGLDVTDIKVDASVVKNLTSATSCTTIFVAGTTLNTGDIPLIAGNTDIVIADTVTTAQEGAVTADNTSKIYVAWSTMPVEYNANWIADKSRLHIYSADMPDSEMWAANENYYYINPENARVEWVCEYQKGLIFADAVTPADGTYVLKKYVGKANDVVIPDTYNGGNVIGISNNAFREKLDITSLHIGANVASIGVSAVENCAKLTTITGGANVTSIGENAFRQCMLIDNVSFPNVKTIGKFAFYQCNALKKISISDVEEMAQGVFERVPLEGEIVLPKLKNLGESALSNTNMTRFEAPELLNIGKYVLSRNKSMTYANMGKITTITEDSLSSCTALNEVIAPNVKTIEGWAFYNTHDNNSTGRLVIDLSKVETIGGRAFTNSSIVTANLSSIVQIADSFDGASLLETVEGNINLESIPQNLFRGCSSLTGTVNMPNTLTIGQSAFSGCGKLLHVNMPNVTTIERYAFQDTTLLEDATLDKVLTINTQGFFHSGIKEVNLPLVFENAMISGVFEGCPRLVTATISKANELRGTFKDCTSLQTVNLPNVAKIEYQAFQGCTSLLNVNTSSKLTNIQGSAFNGAGDKVQGFVISDLSNVIMVDQNAFMNSVYGGGTFAILESVMYQSFTNATIVGKLFFPALNELEQESFSQLHAENGELHFTSVINNVQSRIFDGAKIKYMKWTGCVNYNSLGMYDNYTHIGILECSVEEKHQNRVPNNTDILILTSGDLTTNLLGGNDKNVVLKKEIVNAASNSLHRGFEGNVFIENSSIPLGFASDWTGELKGKVYLYSASKKTSGMPANVAGYWHFNADGRTPEIWV